MRSVRGFIDGLTILAKYMEAGLDETFFMGGEHDIIHVYVSPDACPEDSDDGKALKALGFHTQDEGWAYYT